MRKQLLPVLTALLLFPIAAFSQTDNGPDYFETYMEDFEDSEAQGWTGILNSRETDWTVVDGASVNDQGSMQLNSRDVGDDMVSAVYDEATFENYTVSAVLYPGWGNKTGIIFNYQDEDNFYVVEHWANEKTIYLREKVGGSWETGEGGDASGGYFWDADSLYLNTAKYENRIDTAVASDWIEGFGAVNTMKVSVATDGKTSVYFNDVTIFEDIELIEWTKGKVGLFTHWNNLWADDFMVESNASSTSIVPATKAGSLTMYPNPVTGGHVTIDVSGVSGSKTVQIYSVDGKLIHTENLWNTDTYNFNTNEALATKGLYFIKVSTKDSLVVGKLFVK